MATQRAATSFIEDQAREALGVLDKYAPGRPSGDPPASATAEPVGNHAPKAQSQSLSGFNDGLLMHRQVMQLPVADPLGFPDYKAFTETIVKGAVGGQNRVSPEPHFDFHPIRTGQMRIRRLRLVDSFGQVRDVALEFDKPLLKAHAYELPEMPVDVQLDDAHRTVYLPPRLTQPARVNFRWLAAAGDSQEVNSHPLTSPICGWVIPNNADGSLMIYDGAGDAVGYVELTGRWRPAPGRSTPLWPHDIENPHLRRMVEWVCRQAREVAKAAGTGTTVTADPVTMFMEDFLATLDTALENIEPESFAQHQSLALLIGRPMALVRVSVNIELQGLPAARQSWEDLQRRIAGEPPGTDGFCDVQFPIRIGEHMQLNDGVVGYWLEDTGGYSGDTFWAPQSEHIDLKPGEKLFLYREDTDKPLCFLHSINDPPQIVTMLMDPRGLAHCTSGILPTKALALPVEHTSAALKQLKVSFLSAPVLTDPGHINIPLPNEPGFTWSWMQLEMQKRGLRWTELSTTPMVELAVFKQAFPDDYEDVWQWLIANRRITQNPGVETADVRPRSQWADVADAVSFRDGHPHDVHDIERVLAQIKQEARFGPTQEIREGWLELTPHEDTTKPSDQ